MEDRRAYLIARVSSAEQETEGFSNPAQLRRLRDYAEREGLTVVEEVALAETASKPARRKHWSALISKLRGAKAPAHVVLEKVDRSSRNMADYVVLDELVKEGGLVIHFVREGLRISRESDPSTEMMWGMLALMARQFAQNLSLEVRKGMNEAQAAGLWMFKAPIGFRNARNAAGRSAPLEHDEIAAPILTKIFTAYATGAHTLRSCAELADEMGLRTPRGRVLAPQEISYVLRHPLYAGWIPVNGHKGGNRAYGEDSHLVEAAHEPIIDRATWRKVQEILDGRNRKGKPVKRGYRHAYGGLFTCGHCGSSVVGHRVKGRGGVYTYYRCGSGKNKGVCEGSQYVREERITEQLTAQFAELHFPASVLDDIREQLRGSDADEQETIRKAKKAIQQSRARLERRLTTSYNDRLDDRITFEQYDEFRRSSEAEIERLDEQAKELEGAGLRYREEGLRIMDRWRNAAELFQGRDATITDRRAMVTLAMVTPFLMGDSIVTKLAEPLEMMAVAARAERAAPGSSEKVDPEWQTTYLRIVTLVPQWPELAAA